VKLLRDRSDAYRIEAATALGKLKSDSVAADRALFRLLDPRSDNPPLLSAVILALGKHGFRPALENIEKCLQHPDHGVFDAAVKALGEIADLGSLRTLRDAYESNFLDPEKGVNVSVDTGAPGNADRAAAQGKAKTKIRLRRPNRDKVLTEMRETLKKITGQDFAEPKDLMEWMRENEHRIKKEGWR
jgi:HEAT repeat protein